MTMMVSLHSFRHGTGKTSLVANMAVVLARQGFRVGIMDTDWQTAGVHLLFGQAQAEIDIKFDQLVLGSSQTPKSAFDHLQALEPQQLRGSIVLVPNRSQVTDITKLLRNGLDVVDLSYQLHHEIEPLHLDYLLVDAHPGFDEGSLFLMTLADLVLIVISPDQQDLQGAAVLIELANHLDIRQIQLVGNQIPAYLQPEQVTKTLETTYGIPLAGLLPFSEDILELAGQGILYLQQPEHPYSQKVEAIVKATIQSNTHHSEPTPQLTMPVSQDNDHPQLEGLKMSQMILLPAIQRRLINWLLRQTDGETLENITEFLNEPKETTDNLVKALIEQNYLKVLQGSHPPRYKANIASKAPPPRRSERMWDVLDDL